MSRKAGRDRTGDVAAVGLRGTGHMIGKCIAAVSIVLAIGSSNVAAQSVASKPPSPILAHAHFDGTRPVNLAYPRDDVPLFVERCCLLCALTYS